MKRRFLFCGSAPSYMMGVFEAKAFGQVLELTEDEARDASLGGSAIAPAEDIAAIFTDEQWKKYSAFGSHVTAGEDFQQGRRLALVACHEFRVAMEVQSV